MKAAAQRPEDVGVSDEVIARLMMREVDAFLEARPMSKALFERARKVFVGGVPMQWMIEWAGAFPVFAARAEGARVIDVDGHSYVDFCLGDTGAMFGHGSPSVAEAVAEQARSGMTLMLPNEDGLLVAENLAGRFGLPYWQMTVTATDANRFVLRLAREITGRPYVAVFNGCYHGTVDETFVSLHNGRPENRSGNVGPAVDPSTTTRVAEFNDLEGLERILEDGKVACVLTEPALTNIGIVLPEPAFHEGLRALTRRHGTLLVIDETHTISTGPGGYTRAHDLEPDFLTLGKPIGSGVPAAVYGMTAAIAEQVSRRTTTPSVPVAGLGGTLAANWLSMRAMRVTLESVMTEENYRRMSALAEKLAAGIDSTIRRFDLPWHVTRIGARLEYRFQRFPPRNGSEAASGAHRALDRLMHLFCLNRGVMITPMHSMLLVSPFTSDQDIDRHNEVFDSLIAELVGHA